MSRNVLVVGGTGWVGEEIVSQLLAMNDNVTLLVHNANTNYKNVQTIKFKSRQFSSVFFGTMEP